MGFLKRLPSFNKRNRNKIAERSPAPSLLDPLKENVKPDAPLNVTPLDAEDNMNTKSTDSTTPPSTNNVGLFDDIFAELNQTSTQDSLQAGISLSLALSQQLQLDCASNQQAAQIRKSDSSSAKVTTNLSGQDSIYSKYVTKPQQEDNIPSPPTSNAGVATSSYDETIGTDENLKAHGTTTTQMVLDSDVSGSDDDDDNDDEIDSEDEAWGTQQQLECPIKERRRYNVNRNNGIVESGQTMLDRMKNRHRQQVKLSRPPAMMKPTSPIVYAPPSSASAMAVPLQIQRNSPTASHLTRSASASSANRHHASPWISDYTPSRPSPLSSNRSLRLQPSTLRLASTTSQDNYDHWTSSTNIPCSDDHEDADDEADHDNTILTQRRLATSINGKKQGLPIHHSSSVPDFKNVKRQDACSPPSTSSQTLVSDQQSTVSLSSSSSSSTSTTTTSTTSRTPAQRHLFSNIQRQEASSLHQMKTMTSEPNLKQLASLPQNHPHPMHGYHQLFYNQQQQLQLQQQRQRMQLEWEMMQLYQREQQLKQEYMLLQQRSYLSPIPKSSTLPSLSTAYQDPRFCYPSSSVLGPGLY